jgi:hypothetical protein
MHERRHEDRLRDRARLGAAVAVASLVLVAACSSDDSSADRGASRPSSTSTSTTAAIVIPTSPVTVAEAGSPWTRDEAVQRYREVVGPLSRQLAGLSAMAPDTSATETQAALGAYANASKAAADALAAGSWAADLRTPVNGLIASLLAQADAFGHLAGLPDVAAVQAESDATARTIVVTRTAAAALEQQLGIADGLLGPAAAPPSATSTTDTTPAGQ